MSYIEKRRPDLFNDKTKNNNIFALIEDDYKYAKEVDIEEYDSFVLQNQPLIIDLRGNMAFKNIHIKDSINITDIFFDELVNNGLPFPKDKKVLLVCPTGDKSRKYSAYLNKNGLDVYSLKGGFNNYRLQNKELVREIRSIDFDLF
jgi:cysteine synthase B